MTGAYRRGELAGDHPGTHAVDDLDDLDDLDGLLEAGVDAV